MFFQKGTENLNQTADTHLSIASGRIKPKQEPSKTADEDQSCFVLPIDTLVV